MAFGLIAVFISLLLGPLPGRTSGYFGGLLDAIIQRVI